MHKLFLFDNFNEEIIKYEDREKGAPMERYFELSYGSGDADIYIDTYWVDYTNREVIDFAYTYNESWNVDERLWYEALYTHLESHGLERKYYNLKRRIYPKERFKRLLQNYYFGKDLDTILDDINKEVENV